MDSLLTRVPITVEATAGGRFIARAELKLEAEGATAEEAVANLQAEVQPAPAPPLQPMTMSDQPNPWVAMVGWLPDDELTAAWRQAMADRRAELAARELVEDAEVAT